MRIAAMPLLQLVACAFATKCTGDVSTVAVTGEVTATLPVPPEVPWIKIPSPIVKVCPQLSYATITEL